MTPEEFFMFTNPLYWIAEIIVFLCRGVWFLFKHTQIPNLWFIQFNLKNLEKGQLEGLIDASGRMISRWSKSRWRRWGCYIHKLAIEKAILVLNTKEFKEDE